MKKRKIEVFTAGCVVCDDTVKLVQELACSSCDVTIYDLSKMCESKECLEKAKKYGITSVPTVVIDGKIADCCVRNKPTREDLIAAGIGKTF